MNIPVSRVRCPIKYSHHKSIQSHSTFKSMLHYWFIRFSGDSFDHTMSRRLNTSAIQCFAAGIFEDTHLLSDSVFGNEHAGCVCLFCDLSTWKRHTRVHAWQKYRERSQNLPRIVQVWLIDIFDSKTSKRRRRGSETGKFTSSFTFVHWVQVT